MQKVTFDESGTNELIFGPAQTYMITSLDGIGHPEVLYQSQKAPYQDGSTYIDALYQEREIILKGAILTPQDFPHIYEYRRDLQKKLSVKNGQKVLKYENDYGIWYIDVSAKIDFPNKDFQDPCQHFQITFTAQNPYWRIFG